MHDVLQQCIVSGWFSALKLSTFRKSGKPSSFQATIASLLGISHTQSEVIEVQHGLQGAFRLHNCELCFSVFFILNHPANLFSGKGQIYDLVSFSGLTWGGDTFIKVRVQAVRLNLRPRPAVWFTLSL